MHIKQNSQPQSLKGLCRLVRKLQHKQRAHCTISTATTKELAPLAQSFNSPNTRSVQMVEYILVVLLIEWNTVKTPLLRHMMVRHDEVLCRDPCLKSEACLSALIFAIHTLHRRLLLVRSPKKHPIAPLIF